MSQQLMEASSEEMKCTGAMMISPVPERDTGFLKKGFNYFQQKYSETDVLTRTLSPETKEKNIPILVMGNTGDPYLQFGLSTKKEYEQRMKALLGDDITIDCEEGESTLSFGGLYGATYKKDQQSADELSVTHQAPMQKFYKPNGHLIDKISTHLNPPQAYSAAEQPQETADHTNGDTRPPAEEARRGKGVTFAPDTNGGLSEEEDHPRIKLRTGTRRGPLGRGGGLPSSRTQYLARRASTRHLGDQTTATATSRVIISPDAIRRMEQHAPAAVTTSSPSAAVPATE